MRAILIGLLLAIGSVTCEAGPLVEQYLHSGRLAQGEQALELALANAPVDDQLRFGLAVLQLVRGVERLGQALYEYGCLAENTNATFLRIPLPKNPDPSPITCADLRRLLDGFRTDLADVESTLSEIKSDDVRLPLRMSEIRFDLTGKGDANEKFVDLLKKLLGPGFKLDAANPDFLICFDRGDVAWLRAYCHLLMGLVDLNLAFETEEIFAARSREQFAKPKHRYQGTPDEHGKALDTKVKVAEPARLGHFRKHILKVCELNRETWAFIRKETDDDHEWLPNPRQVGVLHMPVKDEMIDAWLEMVGELEGLYDGKKCIPKALLQFVNPSTKKGFNMKAFLDNPPEDIDLTRIQRHGFLEQNLDDALPDMDVSAFLRVGQIFQNSLAVGYAAWFN